MSCWYDVSVDILHEITLSHSLVHPSLITVSHSLFHPFLITVSHSLFHPSRITLSPITFFKRENLKISH